MTATETIDAEVILKEILEVFEKYSVPVNTVEVDFSLLDQDFDLMFPHLREYKSGIFYKSLVIDGKPATLRAGRRYPFDELVKWFEQHVLPLAQDIATDIQREFQDVIAQVRVTHHENETGRNGVEYYYRISVRSNLSGPHCWPLGVALDGIPLHSSRPLNVYGRPTAVADWLKSLVLHSLAVTPTGLMVIDGAGQLGPALKRQRAVTQRLGQQVVYVDLNNPAISGGYNPLSAAPGEQEKDTLARWQRWFGAMGVHREGLALLARAQQEGVTDIPALLRWLDRPRQHQLRAAASLRLVLERLLAEPALGDWLAWPTNCFDALAEGSLIFTCSARSWAHTQLLLSTLLVAAGSRGLRIVAHGIPWTRFPAVDFSEQTFAGSNGPLTPGSIAVLVAGAGRLGPRFFPLDAQMQENLYLLGQGEAVIVTDGSAVYAGWPIQRRAAL